jgi:outer membrane lipoprotein-sorting protein
MLILVLPLILFTSCKWNDDLYNANKKILQMESYSTIADITVYSNKGISHYKAKHIFKAPDKIRIETIEPDFLKGKVLVGNNGKWKIYHPLIDQSFETTELKESEDLIFLGILQKGILSGEEAKYSYIKKDGSEFIEVKSVIPDGNMYRKSIKVILYRENFLPYELEIYDSNNKPTVRVKYTDFKYNAEIKDSQFEL